MSGQASSVINNYSEAVIQYQELEKTNWLEAFADHCNYRTFCRADLCAGWQWQ